MKDNLHMRIRILKRYERCYTVIINAFCNFSEIHAKQGSMKVCGHILGVALLMLCDSVNCSKCVLSFIHRLA